MRLIRLLFLLMALAMSSPGRGYAWQYWLGSLYRDDELYMRDVAIDANGDVVVVGETSVLFGFQSQRPLIRKLSADGVELWSYQSDAWSRAKYAQFDEVGDLYVVGLSLRDEYPGTEAPFIMKFEGSSGTPVWGGPLTAEFNDDAHVDAYALIPVAGGVITSFGDHQSSYRRPAKIHNFDSGNGSTRWSFFTDAQPPSTYRPGLAITDFRPAGAGHVFAVRPSESRGAGSSTELLKYVSATGEELWRSAFRYDRGGSVVVDPNGDVIMVSSWMDGGGVTAAKIDGDDGSTLWRQEFRDAPLPFRPAITLDSSANIVVSMQVAFDGLTRLVRLDNSTGGILADHTVAHEISRILPGPNGTFIVGSSSHHYAPVWLAALDADLTSFLWERRFEGPANDAIGSLVKLIVQGDQVTLGAMIESSHPIDCDCRTTELMVTRVSAIDGSDTQACGNGIIDPGEHCDDGNSDEYDDCPSHSSSGCRFSTSLARGRKAAPKKDANACGFEWYVANPVAERDRYGLLSDVITCHDQDQLCDSDPAEGACGFRVATCLNNQDIRLPACVADGVSRVELMKPKFSPRLRGEQAEQTVANLLATLVDASSHLLDPANPAAGYTYAPPLASHQRNLCSQLQTISVPLARDGDGYRRAALTMSAKIERMKDKLVRTKSKLKLVCLPVEVP